MRTEQGLLKQMILWLWNRHRKAAEKFSGKLGDLYNTISKNYMNFHERELENLLNSSRINFLEQNRFLFLEPPEGGDCILPILTLMYDFDSAVPDFGIRIALFFVR